MSARWTAFGLVAACAATLSAQEAPQGARPVPLARFRTAPTAFTSYSGLADSAALVVRDSATWRDVWRRINAPFLPPPPEPAIDFAHEMVVVAALGRRPSGGYDVVIEDAHADDDSIDVDLRISNPSPGCPVTSEVTEPVDLARIPITQHTFRFRYRTVTVPCGSPSSAR